MICPLCSCYIISVDKKLLYIKGSSYYLHKKCLRKATKSELVLKGLIKLDDNSWWAKLSGD